jgi:hypothetical protein
MHATARPTAVKARNVSGMDFLPAGIQIRSMPLSYVAVAAIGARRDERVRLLRVDS